MAYNVQAYFIQHPLFYVDEIKKGLNYFGREGTLYRLIQYHLSKGHLKRIKQGLYAYIQPPASTAYVDEYLLGSKLSKDAIIGYQSALGYWGSLYSVRHEILYLTSENVSQPKFFFNGIEYRSVLFSKKLVETKNELYGVELVDRLGQKIRVTCIERTLVDVLDRFDLIKSWEEIYRSFELIEALDVKKVVEYALLLENATTIAKVGFFLEKFKHIWFIEDLYLDKLKQHKPKSLLYLDRKSKSRKVIPEWNLVVPEALVTRSWEEPYEDI